MKKTSNHRFLYLMLLLLLPSLSAGSKPDSLKKEDEAKEQKQKEVLQKRLAEEKKIKARFDYSFNDVSDRIVTVSCESSRGRSSGSAFIAQMDGKTYLFTNQHVILGAEKISFKIATGETLRPLGVELSTTLDIARLLLANEEGFIVSKNMAMDAPIAVFGNSEGGGVATELYGKVTAVGAEVIEVSADFVSGNSGSPVLNLDREVIGIASYVSWSTSDKDKPETRRFCYRLTNNRWESVNWKKYNDKYGTLYRENEQLIDSIFEVASRWYQEPFNRMNADDHPDYRLRKWSTGHNYMINRIARMREKGRATQHELDNVNKQIRKDMSDSAEDLSMVCRDRARQMTFLASQKELTTFLRDEFGSLASRLENAAEQIEDYGGKLAQRDFFHFTDK